MSAEEKIAVAAQQAAQDTLDAVAALKPLVGLEAEYPQLVYDRMRTMKHAQGRMEGLRLALRIIREES